MKSITRHIITDLIILAIMTILTVLISKDVFGIRMRGWYQSDFLTIGYQRTLPETVPMKEALGWVLGGPFLIFIFFWIFIDRIFSNDFNGQTIESEVLTEEELLDQFSDNNNGGRDNNNNNDGKRQFYEQLLPDPSSNNSSTCQNQQLQQLQHQNIKSNDSIIVENNNNNGNNNINGLTPNQNIVISSVETGNLTETLPSQPLLTLQSSISSPLHQISSSQPQSPSQSSSSHSSSNTRQYSINWGTVIIPGQTPRQRKLRFAFYQFYSFCFIIILSLFICNSIKNIVGSLRPDFLSCCNPDYTHPDLIIGTNGWIDHKYESIVCRGTEKEVLEAHKSFPSGHSSSAMASSLYIAIYLFKRLWNRGQRNGIGYGILSGQTLTPFLIISSLLIAFCIAATRHIDNRHRFADISVGLVLGAISALVSLWLGPFTPSYECDGSIITPRSQQQQLIPLH